MHRWALVIRAIRGVDAAVGCTRPTVAFATQCCLPAPAANIEGAPVAGDGTLDGRFALGTEITLTASDGFKLGGFRSFEHAVTDEQISEWSLPTRPAKEDADEIAVELDAIPPERLIGLVSSAIESLVDPDAWAKEQLVEESERQILERLVAQT